MNNNSELLHLKEKILKLENEIHNLTQKLMIDGLTGVFNRRHLEEIEMKKWNNKVCYVSFVDSNRLKLINDEYGHALGDKHLIEIANTLKPFGTVIRYGGDEFVVLSNKPTSLQSTNDFAVGKSIKQIKDDLLSAIKAADKDMYVNKSLSRKKD